MYNASLGHSIRDPSGCSLRPAIPQGVELMEQSQDRMAKHPPVDQDSRVAGRRGESAGGGGDVVVGLGCRGNGADPQGFCR